MPCLLPDIIRRRYAKSPMARVRRHYQQAQTPHARAFTQYRESVLNASQALGELLDLGPAGCPSALLEINAYDSSPRTPAEFWSRVLRAHAWSLDILQIDLNTYAGPVANMATVLLELDIHGVPVVN